MDVVIPVAEEPRNRYIELALASIVRAAPFVNLVIGGHTYPFVNDRRFKTLLPVPQAPGAAFENTNRIMREACLSDEVSDPFVWAADDIFWRHPVTEPDLYHHGSVALRQLAEAKDAGLHGRYAHVTHRTLVSHGLPTWSYERHVPLVIYKEDMMRAFELGLGSKRSLYQNLRRPFPLSVEPDVKVWTPDQPVVSSHVSPFFSVGPKYPVEHLALLLDASRTATV